jgi:hypothetical protein
VAWQVTSECWPPRVEQEGTFVSLSPRQPGPLPSGSFQNPVFPSV